MWVILIVVAILIVVLLWFIAIYNRFIFLRNGIQAAWAQIDVQLKRRYDLVPNLVETVKGYAKHERELFERVTEARARAIAAGSVGEQSQAENMLTSALRSLFAVAENYPELKASQNFLKLQEELSDIENRIAYARQHYNDVVQTYNTSRQQFPASVVASLFAFPPSEYFEVEELAREVPRVSFTT